MLRPPRPAGAGGPAVGGVCWDVAGGAAWESAFRAVPNTAQTTSIDFRIALTESPGISHRSEEHTSELQSLRHLVCRLLLEKTKTVTESPSTSAQGEPQGGRLYVLT